MGRAKNGHRLNCLSVSRLAALVGIHRTTATRRLTRSGVKPVGGHGRAVLYYAPDVLKLRDFARRPLDPAAEKARLDAAKADATELELARRRGERVEADEVEWGLTEVSSVLRTRLLAVPAKVAPELVGRDAAGCCDVVEAALTEALEVLADLRVERVRRHAKPGQDGTLDKGPDRSEPGAP